MTNSIRKNIVNQLISEYSDQEHLIAIQLAQLLELEISQRESELKLIAKLPEIMSGDTSTCNKKLLEIYNNPQNKLGNLGRVGLDGVFKCSLNEKLIGVQSSTLGSYIKDILNDTEHRPVMSRAFKPIGSDSYLIAIHVPVFDDLGNFTGTVGGAIYLNDLKKNYMKDIQLSKGGYVSLYDDDGTVLNNPKPELIGTNFTSPEFQKLIVGASKPEKALKGIQDGVSGTRRYFFDSDEKIAAFEPIHIFRDRKWRVVVTLPISTADNNIIKIGADKALSGLLIAYSTIILLIYVTFLWFVKKKI